MKAGTYEALAELCAPHLLRATPGPFDPSPDYLPDARCAIYIAIDARGKVCYVGTVCRPRDSHGLASHVADYLRSLSKTDRWASLYVLQLHPATPEPEVRRIGGDIADWLLPYDRERWRHAS